VIQYLRSISGSFTIAGQHNREPNSDPTKWNRVVNDIVRVLFLITITKLLGLVYETKLVQTGVNPGLWGGDFLFLPDDVRDRQIMVNEAINQWNSGSLVALTWHVCPPNRPQETCNWDSDGILSSLTDTQWNDVVTDGGILNRAYKGIHVCIVCLYVQNLMHIFPARLDTVVPFLKQLKNAGVVPIFRPIHEINEGWSWWGGRGGSNGSRKLYQLTHDYLVQYHGLDNMIWTWCVKDVDMGNIGDYWPGENYVDVASLDMWVKQYPTNADYQAMLNLAGNIPIALAEVGSVPSPSVLQQQNRWTWFGLNI
jgi:mannan endo-1,4-beta-mannosidase